MKLSPVSEGRQPGRRVAGDVRSFDASVPHHSVPAVAVSRAAAGDGDTMRIIRAIILSAGSGAKRWEIRAETCGNL
jgi:hypothetical protein